jgi:tRNA-modifying protein YgfZ
VVGRLGTVVVSPVHGPIALAILRREAAPGDTLAVADGAMAAEVVALPFEG